MTEYTKSINHKKEIREQDIEMLNLSPVTKQKKRIYLDSVDQADDHKKRLVSYSCIHDILEKTGSHE